MEFYAVLGKKGIEGKDLQSGNRCGRRVPGKKGFTGRSGGGKPVEGKKKILSQEPGNHRWPAAKTVTARQKVKGGEKHGPKKEGRGSALPLEGGGGVIDLQKSLHDTSTVLALT